MRNAVLTRSGILSLPPNMSTIVFLKISRTRPLVIHSLLMRVQLCTQSVAELAMENTLRWFKVLWRALAMVLSPPAVTLCWANFALLPMIGSAMFARRLAEGYTCMKLADPNDGLSAALLSAAALATGRKSTKMRRHVSAWLTNASSILSKESSSSKES